ncbi:MAG: hypothetical protein J6I79_08320 [Paludibacteraceae bacterium]|nr:hypothetical protein [Paludibacteraceae bacterium]
MKVKFLIATLFSIVTLTCFAKGGNQDVSVVDSYVFYGVNFSKCHTFGWGQNPEQTLGALSEINGLFISEMDKYDIRKFLKKNVDNMDVDVSVKQTLNRDPKTLETYNETERLSVDTIKNVIKGLELKENKGYGLMIFADFLNKKKQVGIYQYVFFDIASREIVETWEATGEAGGFGFRNYWAKSVYNTLKTNRFKKLYYRGRELGNSQN